MPVLLPALLAASKQAPRRSFNASNLSFHLHYINAIIVLIPATLIPAHIHITGDGWSWAVPVGVGGAELGPEVQLDGGYSVPENAFRMTDVGVWVVGVRG